MGRWTGPDCIDAGEDAVEIQVVNPKLHCLLADCYLASATSIGPDPLPDLPTIVCSHTTRYIRQTSFPEYQPVSSQFIAEFIT